MIPIEEIKTWIEDKPTWWKHSVKLALENGELDQNNLDEIYQVARIEHGLELPLEKSPPYQREIRLYWAY